MSDLVGGLDLEKALGADLLALVRTRGAPLATVAAITGLPSPVRTRAAFMLEFADGTRLKGRRLRSPERAATVHRLQAVIGKSLPRVLGRQGDALLLEWVEGQPLSSLEVIPPHALRRCGRMLGELHRAHAGHLHGGHVPTTRRLLDKLERGAALLQQAGCLDADLARRALAAAAAARPEEATVGIIHKDFCAENIVLDPEGVPVPIDNATLSVGPHDLDVARTWYRWRMSPHDRRHLAAGYEQSRSLASCRRHFAFWASCVLVGSASTRLRSQTTGARKPIEILGALLPRLERGTTDAGHPFWTV